MTESKQTDNRTPGVPAEFALDISSTEGQFVEFKESLSELSKEIVAFANAEGGRIYLGITDKKEIKGIAYNNRMASQIQDTARGCDPSVTINLHPFDYEGRQILLIQIPESKQKPHACSAGFYVRMGPNSQKLNRDEIVDLAHSMSPKPYELRDCRTFSYPKDFDAADFRTFLKMADISTKRLSTLDLLVNLEFARHENSHVVFNNAGVLFFAKNPIRFLSQSRVTCVVYETAKRVEILDRKDLEFDLLDPGERSPGGSVSSPTSANPL